MARKGRGGGGGKGWREMVVEEGGGREVEGEEAVEVYGLNVSLKKFILGSIANLILL